MKRQRWSNGQPAHRQPRYGHLDISGGRLICHECGETFLHLATHARATHDLDSYEYRVRWGLGVTTSLVAPAVAAELSRKASQPHRLAHLEAVRDPARLQANRGEQSWRPEVVRKAVERGEAQRRAIPGDLIASLPVWTDLIPWAHAAHRIIDAGYSTSELARTVGRPPATVAQRLRRHPRPAAPAPRPLRGAVRTTNPYLVFADRAVPLMERYLAGRQTPRTRANHRQVITHWMTWCAANGCNPLTIKRSDLELYLAGERDRGLTPTSVASKATILRVYYRWLTDEQAIADDPAARVSAPRPPRPSGRSWLAPGDLRRFLTYAREHADPELAVAVHLMALSGLRPGELLALDHSHIGRYDTRMVLTVNRGKATGSDRILLPETTAQLIHRLPRQAGGPLFHGPSGERLRYSRLRTAFITLVQAAGVPPVMPYGLRTGMITLALEAGIPERDVMIAAGHKSSSQTAHYDRLRANVSQERNAGRRLAEMLGIDPAPDEPA